MQLLGNVNNRVSPKGRARVLSKTFPKYGSFSNESWETHCTELFGQQFEQRLMQWAETAKAIPGPVLSTDEKRFSALTQEIKQNKDFMENIDYGPRGWTVYYMPTVMGKMLLLQLIKGNYLSLIN